MIRTVKKKFTWGYSGMILLFMFHTSGYIFARKNTLFGIHSNLPLGVVDPIEMINAVVVDCVFLIFVLVGRTIIRRSVPEGSSGLVDEA